MTLSYIYSSSRRGVFRRPSSHDNLALDLSWEDCAGPRESSAALGPVKPYQDCVRTADDQPEKRYFRHGVAMWTRNRQLVARLREGGGGDVEETLKVHRFCAFEMWLLTSGPPGGWRYDGIALGARDGMVWHVRYIYSR